MNVNKEIKTLIEARNSGKRIPALNIIQDSPLTAALLSKLHSNDRYSQYDSDGNKKIISPSQTGLSEISRDIAQKSTDNENILQMFPELEEGLRILVNGTMAPKDLNTTEINFSAPADLKVSTLTPKLLPIVEEALSKDFKLKEMLPDMLYYTLGIDGSYPMVVIPESSVDDMINDNRSISTESLVEHFGNGTSKVKSKGLLGDSDIVARSKKETITFESFVTSTTINAGHITDPRVVFKEPDRDAVLDTYIRVTDNYDILKFPELVKIKRDQEVNKILAQSRGSVYNGALENIGIGTSGNYGSTELNDIQLTQLLYKNSLNIRNVTRKVKDSNETKRYNIGAPLIKLLPAESVIPVVLSGDKKNHIAYFVLLDGLGNALSKDNTGSVFEDFRRNQIGFKQGSNLASHLIQRAATSFNTECKEVTYSQMQKICTDIIETDFLSRLRNGIYGEDVALVDNSAFYDILLSRMFREQQTQVLFVPASLLTYFHYKLRKNGTGKTLLEDSLVLNSLRSVLLFSNVNRSVINSMGKTEIELTVDENDPNKQKTLEIAKHEALKTRQSQALPATISPTDIQQYLQTSQMYFNLTAVPGLPSTSMKFTETATNYVKPDTELMSELDKKAILALGIPPELVANSREVEFATNIIANNLRLTKQINNIQEKFNPQINKLARCYCMNHGEVVQKIENTIRTNIGEITETKDTDDFISQFKENQDVLIKLLAREFLSNFEISFSKPDTVTLKTQMEAFDEFEGSVDKAINFYLSDDILSEATSGTITSEQVGLVRNSVKAYLIRDFLRKNNILPELFDIVKTDADGKQDFTVFKASSSHSNAVTLAIKDFLTKVTPIADAAESDVNAVTGGKDLGTGPSASSSSGGSSDTSIDEESGTTDEGMGDLAMPEMPDFDNL